MLSEEEQQKEFLKPIDNLTYKSFVKAFNEKYDNSLLSEQKDLLKVYINSFTDNGIDLKIFLNEEISRLKDIIEESKSLEDIRKDPQMLESTNQVLDVLDSLKERD